MPTVAVDGEGVDELLEAAFKRLSTPVWAGVHLPATAALSFRLDYGPAIEAEIASLEGYLPKACPVGAPSHGAGCS